MLQSSHEAASEILRLYPVTGRGACLQLGNHGGFSGALLWRISEIEGDFCLRLWPQRMTSHRLRDTHLLMARARRAGCFYVPEVIRTSGGQTFDDRNGRLWELSRWLPGKADFRDQPSLSRLEKAFGALAHLHQAWMPAHHVLAVPPAIGRRLACTQEWHSFVDSGGRVLDQGGADPVRPLAERGWSLVCRRIGTILQMLAPWSHARLPVQPCLCDIWHDHVLFDGEAVTGIVDFGALKMDHIAVDLARLLGSMVADQAEWREVGLRAYRQVRPLSAEEEGLVDALDRTGTVLAIANWLMWLYRDRKESEDRKAVAERLTDLITRVENW